MQTCIIKIFTDHGWKKSTLDFTVFTFDYESQGCIAECTYLRSTGRRKYHFLIFSAKFDFKPYISGISNETLFPVVLYMSSENIHSNSVISIFLLQ